ncbi:sigma factor-like helix-turn-helix DNA-binding protein [Streptomyces camelliae]|uniref:Sigma factor-like helix-turn-helix DNA-binding protein n=1 Tax=Streptomyces camelliae TaxID=3004093 RepID=A0ABY7PIP1_9ACTN|nr:sigma factor-like helix-turn-helix DNA-binding protein [Streptomyces sp. HUAS 2-6]WBO69657.1 sigma factor-like helix-turn-helix DNA-binding protein [Streptomyces sp. HUAS 2-6]
MTRAEEFARLRPLLFAIAYRILGDARAAHYAVQTARLRWTAQPTGPASVEGHLAADITRIAARALHSARVTQGELVGPLLTRVVTDPDRPADLEESLSLSALMVLERLSPLERAVFVLREAFGCGHAQIASALGCSQEASRRIVAAVAAVSDGGRAPLPWPTCVTGAWNIARLLTAIVPPLLRVGVTLEECQVNGRPGSVFRGRDGAVLQAIALDAGDGRVQRMHLVAPPAGAGHADPVAEACAVLREAGRAD